MESAHITGIVTEPLIEEVRGQYKFYSFRLGKKVTNPKTKEQKTKEITFSVSSFNEKGLAVAQGLTKGEFIEVHYSLGANQSKDGRWFNQLNLMQILVPKVPVSPSPAQEVVNHQPAPQQTTTETVEPPATTQQDSPPPQTDEDFDKIFGT